MVLRCLSLVVLICALIGPAWAQERILKPGNTVAIACEEEPSLNRDYTVTRDGLVIMAFIGAVNVSGLTEIKAAERISAKLVEQRIVRKATVSVRLAGSAPIAGIKYSGAVNSPGEAPYREGIRLSDIVALAEPTTAAEMTAVQIRTGKGEALVVDYAKSQGKANEFNPLLKPGDEITFPLRSKPAEIYVLGGVKNPGAYPVTSEIPLRQAISMAGGPSGLANITSVRIQRDGTTTEVDLTKPDTDPKVRAGDRIVVATMDRRAFVTIEGAIMRPGFVVFIEGMGLASAVHAAGGTRPGAMIKKVKITRLVDGKPKIQEVNAEPILKGLAGDIRLQPNDKIMVPQGRAPRGVANTRTTKLFGGVAAFLLIFGL